VASGIGASGQAKAIAREPAVAGVGDAAQSGPRRPRQHPTETDGGIGATENVEALDHGAIRQDPVDARHQRVERLSVAAGVEPRRGDVVEADPAARPIEPAQHRDFAGAQRTLAIEQHSDLGGHRESSAPRVEPGARSFGNQGKNDGVRSTYSR
jgi:hypothetical protein